MHGYGQRYLGAVWCDNTIHVFIVCLLFTGGKKQTVRYKVKYVVCLCI